MKKILILLVFVIGLSLTACDTEGSNEEGDNSVPFIGGTEGLSLRFVEGFPPDRVLDNGEETFDVIVEMTNEGERNIEPNDIRVTLSGFSPSIFGQNSDALSANSDEILEGNELNPDGSILSSYPVEVVFSDFVHEDTTAGNQEYPFRANVCYEYGTDVVASICVKDNFRDDTEDSDLCSIQSDRTVYNSAGPVQITSFSQTGAGQARTRFTFEVGNLASGEVFRSDTECDNSNNRESNKVFVDLSDLVERQEIDSVTCNGLRDSDVDYEGYVDIGINNGEVSCTVDFLDQSPRIDRFDIDLSYAYEQSIRTDVVVENSN